MKKLFFAFSLILIVVPMSADYNPFYTQFRKHFPDTHSDRELKYLRSFVGDTIYFDIEGDYALHNVFQEEPDTIWIKQKRSKKPKEGKDFHLCYYYKGLKDGKSFYTPMSVFDKKSFGLLSVKEIKNDSFYDDGYDLTLVEPETANIIHVILDGSLPSNWRLYSKESNAKIDKWLGNHFYKKTDYSTVITDFTLTSGELFLECEAISNTLFLFPHGNFILTSENADPLNLNYESQSINKINFYTQTEYQNELENRKVHTINYELPNDSSAFAKMKSLPFMVIWGKTNSYSNYVSQTIEPGSYPLGSHTIPHDTYVLIGDKITVRDKDYYKATLDGKSFFIESSKIDLEKPELLDSLLMQPQDVKNAFFDYAKVQSRLIYYSERKERLEGVKKLIDRGFAVLAAHPYDMSEYTDGTGMTFSFLNTSNKIIKYITINFIGYNAVDDPVPSRGKSLLTRKGIGPIEPFETASYDFEYVWFTDIVDYSKIRSILVQYKNGSTKTFTGEVVKVVPDDVINAMEYESPVIDFLPIFEEDKK